MCASRFEDYFGRNTLATLHYSLFTIHYSYAAPTSLLSQVPTRSANTPICKTQLTGLNLAAAGAFVLLCDLCATLRLRYRIRFEIIALTHRGT